MQAHMHGLARAFPEKRCGCSIATTARKGDFGGCEDNKNELPGFIQKNRIFGEVIDVYSLKGQVMNALAI
jgi:hypothetical protein